MNNTKEVPSVLKEMKTMFILALPVMLGQLAGLSMNFVDTVMSSRAGNVHMAAVGVAGAFWAPIILFGQGLLMSITPLVAQTFSSCPETSRKEKTAVFLRQGIWLALFVGFLLILTLGGLSFTFGYLAYEDELTELAENYLRVMLIGIIPLMLYSAQRSYLEGLALTRPSMFTGFLALAVNIPLNYAFIFGKFGMPALGAVGCAVATVIVCFVMAITMFFFTKRAYAQAFRSMILDLTIIKKILKISFPNATALLMEVSVFALVALFLAPFGQVVIAGHQAALNVSAMVFMIPLGLSIAVAIRTGSAIGAQDREGAVIVRKAASILSLCVGIFNASFLLIFREPIVHLYTDESVVYAVTYALLVFTAIFQIVDAIQVAALGILRGYNDTKTILVLCIISYWLIAIPTGYILTFYGIPNFIAPLEVVGFWIGMIIGLSFAAVLFTTRIFYLEKQPLAQIMKRIS